MADSQSETDVTEKDETLEQGAAESSPAEGVEPKTMLEAVQAAMKPVEAPTTSTAAESPTAGDAGAVKAPDAPQKLDDYAEVPFHTHPRFRQLLKERNTFQGKLLEKDAEISKLKEVNAPQQESLERFTAFSDAVKSAGLAPQEINAGFAIMAEMKRDPAKALEMITPYINDLLEFTGRKLDQDLQKQVDDGLATQDIASQLQRERRRSAWLETQQQGQQQASASERQQRETDALVQTVTSSVSAWEERQKTDPDYQKKQPLVIREIGWLMQQEGYPKSAEAAVAMADKAKATVEANLKSLIPQRQSVRTVTGGASAATAAARPKTLLEAARLGASGQYQPANSTA